MRASIADGAAYSVMVGAGETYFPAFALALGLGEVFAGLTATVPMFTGAIVQCAAPRLIPLAGSHRRWVVLCATLQAVSFVPLVATAIAGWASWPAVMLIATAYWASGLAASPAWNSWMARTVPSGIRAPFFAARTRASHVSVLIGLVASGIVLQFGSKRDAVMYGFAAIFAASAVFRLASAAFLLRQREPFSPPVTELRIQPWRVVQRMGGQEGRLLLYMVAMQIATFVAAPFFTPFMLEQLQLGYAEYVMLLSSSFVAKSLALPMLGRFAHRFGARSLLWVGGTAVVPMAAVWIISHDMRFLVCAQVIGGVAWAAYELATFLLMFETIPDAERTSVLSTFNLLNAAAIVTGTLIGGALLRILGADYSAYLVIFLLSSFGRLLAVPLLRTLGEAPRVPVWIGMRTLAVRPSAGSIDRPILAAVPESPTTNGSSGSTQDGQSTAEEEQALQSVEPS